MGKYSFRKAAKCWKVQWKWTQCKVIIKCYFRMKINVETARDSWIRVVWLQGKTCRGLHTETWLKVVHNLLLETSNQTQLPLWQLSDESKSNISSSFFLVFFFTSGFQLPKPLILSDLTDLLCYWQFILGYACSFVDMLFWILDLVCVTSSFDFLFHSTFSNYLSANIDNGIDSSFFSEWKIPWTEKFSLSYYQLNSRKSGKKK